MVRDIGLVARSGDDRWIEVQVMAFTVLVKVTVAVAEHREVS